MPKHEDFQQRKLIPLNHCKLCHQADFSSDLIFICPAYFLKHDIKGVYSCSKCDSDIRTIIRNFMFLFENHVELRHRAQAYFPLRFVFSVALTHPNRFDFLLLLYRILSVSI